MAADSEFPMAGMRVRIDLMTTEYTEYTEYGF
ncbi:hypothetical protein Caka_1653 [Coraliomargarita akajimensis DSM 45221]|uniref:Uncharacterized protein n=1 Tax=Coraliomargarita akajimensis (strain DSM 45221 / IAM 15411 / JCM 23193 / KCTC 12865 / 04OKA010-24) TaxID=583355 RepID=D5EJS3_CORAD|nr:hypothetical protein Caka_1653 [Coraliomargarita akajimensis DSM 45221]